MITFMPDLLSPLHLACYSRCQREREEEEKDFQKVSQKMRKIMTRYPENETSQDGVTSNVKLFYDVYNHIDDLSLKELKVLRRYCCTIGEINCMVPIKQMENPIEVDRISRLEDTIDNHIKEQKAKVNRFPKRFR